jgi:hypothetical protein
MTFYHTFMVSCWYIEECLSSTTRPGFVSLHQRVVTVTHQVPSVWVYVPVIRSRLCDVPSFTAQCLLLPVALSRDHEHNGVRIKNRAERSEQTERSVGSYFVSVSSLAVCTAQLFSFQIDLLTWICLTRGWYSL